MQRYGKMLRSKKPFLGCGKPGKSCGFMARRAGATEIFAALRFFATDYTDEHR